MEAQTPSGGVPRWAKWLAVLWGLVLLMLMMPLCYADALFSCSGLVLGGLCGGGLFWHGIRALTGKPSRPLRLPAVWVLVGAWALSLVTALRLASGGMIGEFVASPFVALAAALPPLIAVALALNSRPEGMTWRRGLSAFAAGASVSTLLALILEVLVPYFVLWDILDWGEPIRRALEEFTALLAGREVARALTRPFFLIAMANYSVVGPVIEEFTKSLVVLPLLRRVSRRDAFLLGATAGAGFAFLENMVYVIFGRLDWGGILVTRALGAAVHPLGTGLMALAWQALLHGEAPHRWMRWAGGAIAQHGVWNGGILLWSALSGTSFLGIIQETRVIGMEVAAGLLALLAVAGAAAAWSLRSLSRYLAGREDVTLSLSLPEVPTERAVALWAVVSLIVLLPLGLALLKDLWGK